MDTRSRPGPRVWCGTTGEDAAAARLQEDPSMCFLSCPVTLSTSYRPPARPSQRLVLLWLLLLSVPSSTPDAPGFISVANFEEVAEVQGETGSVRACTHTLTHAHTPTHTHAVGALRINIIYRARRFMRTCMHARINAGMTQFSLLARLLLFENPCSPESLLLAKRCMQVYVWYIYVCLCMCIYESKSLFSRGTPARKAL